MEFYLISTLAVVLSLSCVSSEDGCKCELPLYMFGVISNSISPRAGYFHIDFEKNVYVMDVAWKIKHTPGPGALFNMTAMYSPDLGVVHFKYFSPREYNCLNQTLTLPMLPKRCVKEETGRASTFYNVTVNKDGSCNPIRFDLGQFFIGNDAAFTHISVKDASTIGPFKSLFSQCEETDAIFG